MLNLKKPAKKAYSSLKSDVSGRYGRYKEEKEVYKEEYRKAKLKGIKSRAKSQGYKAGKQGGVLSQVNPVLPSDIFYGRPTSRGTKRKKKKKTKRKVKRVVYYG